MATLSRVGLVVLALVAGAWFALGVRQARNTDQATALITATTPLSPAGAQRARSLLDGAATLNPDLKVDILRGELAVDRHENVQAEAILESVTGREPLNLEAWSQLLFAAAKAGDRRTLIRAARNVAALYRPLR